MGTGAIFQRSKAMPRMPTENVRMPQKSLPSPFSSYHGLSKAF
jgi:hypothetical protein